MKKPEESKEENPDEAVLAENNPEENLDEKKDDENIEGGENEGEIEQSQIKTENKTGILSLFENTSVKYREIYKEEKIKELLESPKENRDSIVTATFNELNKGKGLRLRPNQTKAVMNFHIQSINFILENFSKYPLEIIAKLANIFAMLLNLKEDEYNLQLKELEQKSEEPLSKYAEIPEPDFGSIVNKKIMEIKICFSKLKLVPDIKNTFNTENNFYLTNKEMSKILGYLNQCYFPFIRLFYHVININRIETKKIMINKPLAIPNLNDEDNMPEKFIIEEPAKKPIHEMNIDERIYAGMQEKYEEGEGGEFEMVNGQPKMTQNISRGDYATEVRKLITEKVDELRKDVDAKISETDFAVERNLATMKEQYLPQAKKK